MKQNLMRTLAEVGKAVRLHRFQDGITVLVLPYGGRTLGLFGPRSDENFYWTHPALESTATARAFYQSEQWHNSGGDRTWLAPEVDVFLPNYPRTEGYWQPRSLDPGDYRVVQDEQGERLVNRVRCTWSRSQQQVELEITKSLGPAPNPLRFEKRLAGLDVEYAGYTQFTALCLLSDADVSATDRGESSTASGTTAGLWNLIQMPHGGELLVPTYVRTEPRIIFGTISPQDLRSEERLIRYRMVASGEQKLGLRAVACAGRVGYRYPGADGRWALIVRNIFVDPSGLYADVPWDAPDDFGYALQACNVNSGLGSFSELEYHVPAVGQGTGRTQCQDASQVWAFRGTREVIDQVTASLLAVAPE